MNRRSFLSGFAALGALAFVPWVDRAQAQARFSRIVVDTKPLELRGGSHTAAIIRSQLQASLQREFAGSIGRGGPTLVVRVNSLLLNMAYPGGSRGSSGPETDYLEADVTAGSLRFPLMVAQDTSNGGAWYSPDYEPRRLRALADALAYWVRRRV